MKSSATWLTKNLSPIVFHDKNSEMVILIQRPTQNNRKSLRIIHNFLDKIRKKDVFILSAGPERELQRPKESLRAQR